MENSSLNHTENHKTEEKETKRTPIKQRKKENEVLRFIREHIRYFAAGALVVVLILVLAMCAKPKGSDSDVVVNANATESTQATEEVYQVDANENINALITQYYTAYAAGEWAAIEENAEDAPYLRYVCVLDERTRAQHRQWHDLILRYDDPFWATHYPPNGWKCRCSVIQYSDNDLKRRGFVPSKSPQIRYTEWENKRTGNIEQVPEGIAPGFDYNVGKARYRAFTPEPDGNPPQTFQNRAAELPPLPEASPMPENSVLPEGLSDTEYARAFLSEFGADIGKPVVYTDVVGEPLVIDEGVFIDKKSGKYKLNKDNRKKYMKLLAASIKDPDEIWMIWAKTQAGKDILKRRYIKIYEAENGSHCLTVFDKDEDKWAGQTTFTPKAERSKGKRDEYLNNLRDGFLAYKK